MDLRRSFSQLQGSFGLGLLVFLFLLAAWLALPGCSGTTITRDRTTYIAEQYAQLARQTEAADVLMQAAAMARDDGELETCEFFAAPALLIYEVAEAQTYRALWLAGLPYPDDEGDIPDIGTEQPDPGPPDEGQTAAAWCSQE